MAEQKGDDNSDNWLPLESNVNQLIIIQIKILLYNNNNYNNFIIIINNTNNNNSQRSSMILLKGWVLTLENICYMICFLQINGHAKWYLNQQRLYYYCFLLRTKQINIMMNNSIKLKKKDNLLIKK